MKQYVPYGYIWIVCCLLFSGPLVMAQCEPDSTAPTLVCPDNIIRPMDSDTCGAIVTWTLPTVTDACFTPPEDITGFSFIGTYNGNYYYLSQADVNSPADLIVNGAIGGHLVTISDSTENDFLQQYLQQNTIAAAWIGLEDLDENESFNWVDGTLIWEQGMPVVGEYTNWDDDEPDDNQAFVFIGMNGKWTNRDPENHPYIIEIEGPSLTITSFPTAGLDTSSLFLSGVTTLTYTATDTAGNSTSCSFTVTIEEDVEKPKIVNCPDDTTVSCPGPISWTPPTAMDNCDETVMVTSSHVPGDNFSTDMTMVTYTATDSAGNDTTCSFIIMIMDITKPNLSPCPSDITKVCPSPVDWIPPTATDNCDGMLTPNGTRTPNTNFSQGTTVITYTATDAAGNDTSCTFKVIINDTEPPTISCPADITIDACNPVSWIDPTPTDNCGVVNMLTQIPPNLNLGNANAGDYIVTLTAFDAAGNDSSCTFNITVNDNLKVPDVFTPNGDGINDTWDITGVREDDYSVKVFNRAGAEVFASSNVVSKWNGGNMPDGAYWYIITQNSSGNDVRRGAVMIKRSAW